MKMAQEKDFVLLQLTSFKENLKFNMLNKFIFAVNIE